MIKLPGKNKPCRIEYFYRPGRYWTDQQLNYYHQELEEIAGDCFRQIPRYQSLTGSRSEFERNVITIARNREGEAIGFCSAVILDVDGYKNILHLGLTCVKKKARSMGLTHSLTSKLLMNYLIRTSPFNNIWITNVACVLSSLGNIALHFEDVFPSPSQTHPTPDHINIARAVDEKYRDPIAINADAHFDRKHFIFRGSVDHTVFQKSAKDTRYHHRNSDLTQFYLKLLNFKHGDEVIQVGRISILSYPKYIIKMTFFNVLKATAVPIRRVKTAVFSRKS